MVHDRQPQHIAEQPHCNASAKRKGVGRRRSRLRCTICTIENRRTVRARTYTGRHRRRIHGSWFNPQQNGHGFALEVLPGQPMQMLASWFTFAPQGGQAWIVGLGPITGDRAVLQGFQSAGPGGRFPPNFDATAVHQENSGHADLYVHRLRSRARRMDIERTGLWQRRHGPHATDIAGGIDVLTLKRLQSRGHSTDNLRWQVRSMTPSHGPRLAVCMALWLWFAVAPVHGADFVDFGPHHSRHRTASPMRRSRSSRKTSNPPSRRIRRCRLGATT